MKKQRSLQQSDSSAPALDAEPRPVDTSLLDCKHFCNALRVSGILHIADNCLHHILCQTKCWEQLLPKLRILEILLVKPRVSGILHIADNCLHHILCQTKCWEQLLPKLRILEILLVKPLYRERFCFSCLSEPGDIAKLKCWSITLRGLRWKAIMEFCLALLPIERILRWLVTDCLAIN